mmetsp:Transcript_17790/g.55578  ORF Transcript_17790/g.55578 Transcript_17790/m.55578 type:complete len:122 (+) Transcript_17790:3-368(+)
MPKVSHRCAAAAAQARNVRERAVVVCLERAIRSCDLMRPFTRSPSLVGCAPANHDMVRGAQPLRVCLPRRCRWTPSASSFTISSSPWTTLDVCGVNCDRAGAADPRADYTTSCQAHHDPQH